MSHKRSVPKVNQPILYNNMQCYLIKTYLDVVRDNGDHREKNEIVAEWINKNSATFREEWCKYQS